MNTPLSFEQQLSLLDERIEKSWADILESSRSVSYTHLTLPTTERV